MLDLESHFSYCTVVIDRLREQGLPQSYEELHKMVTDNVTPEQMQQAQLVVATVILTLCFKRVIGFAKAFLKYLSNPRENLKLTLFNFIMWLPCGRKYLDKEVKKAREEFHVKIKNRRKNAVYKLPEKAMLQETIMKRIKSGSEESKKYFRDGGKMSGGVYTAKDDHWDFISDVMRQNIESNPLHFTEFANIGQLEAEIIKVTLDLFNGPADGCGLTTSGGTESIFIAMLAYREWGRKKGITKPNIVAPITAHAAFEKACFYLGMELKKIQLKKDFTVDLRQMRKAIDSNTVALIGSAPEYAFGMFDDVPAIAAIAMKYGVNCHSDCCLGSFINPFID